MKANELRIGNYVNHKELGYIQVYGMNGEIIQFDYRKDPYYEEIPFDKLSYIPLTEDILLKCGFEKEEESNCYVNQIALYFTFDKITCNVSYYEYDNLINVDYLHQLQNLYFALTNEELTINL